MDPSFLAKHIKKTKGKDEVDDAALLGVLHPFTKRDSDSNNQERASAAPSSSWKQEQCSSAAMTPLLKERKNHAKSHSSSSSSPPRADGRRSVLTTVLSVPSLGEIARTMISKRFRERWGALLVRAGQAPPPFPFSLEGLDPEPTEATIRALRLATELVSPGVVNHMIRTYYLGLAIHHWKAKTRQQRRLDLPSQDPNLRIWNSEDHDESDLCPSPWVDREAFWVACVLHDVGVSSQLTPPVQPDLRFGDNEEDGNDDATGDVGEGCCLIPCRALLSSTCCRCGSEGVVAHPPPTADDFFEVRGALRAHRFCERECQPPFSPRRAQLVHEAIALHTSVVEQERHNGGGGGCCYPRQNSCKDDQWRLYDRCRYEWAECLFDGAAADLVGSQLPFVSGETIHAVLKKHPKMDFHERFPRMVRREAAERPNSMMALQARTGLFEKMESGGEKFSKF